MYGAESMLQSAFVGKGKWKLELEIKQNSVFKLCKKVY